MIPSGQQLLGLISSKFYQSKIQGSSEWQVVEWLVLRNFFRKSGKRRHVTALAPCTLFRRVGAAGNSSVSCARGVGFNSTKRYWIELRSKLFRQSRKKASLSSFPMGLSLIPRKRPITLWSWSSPSPPILLLLQLLLQEQWFKQLIPLLPYIFFFPIHVTWLIREPRARTQL